MSIADHMATMASHGMGKPPVKPMSKPADGGGHEKEGGADAKIKAHLEQMHAEHGGAHTHIQHHEEGHHTSHSVDTEGKASGPSDHDGAGCAECGSGGSNDHDEDDSEGLM